MQPSQFLVRFSHYGGTRSHAFHTVDSGYKLQAAKEGDIAPKRAPKKYYQPKYKGKKKRGEKRNAV